MSRTVALWALALSVLSLFSLSNAVTVGSVEINSYQGAYQHLLDSIRSNNTGMIQISAAAMSTLMMEGGGSEEQLLTILSEPQLQKMHETLVLNMIDKNPNLVTAAVLRSINDRRIIQNLVYYYSTKGKNETVNQILKSPNSNLDDSVRSLLVYAKSGRYDLLTKTWTLLDDNRSFNSFLDHLSRGFRVATDIFSTDGSVSLLLSLSELAKCANGALCVLFGARKPDDILESTVLGMILTGQSESLVKLCESLKPVLSKDSINKLKQRIRKFAERNWQTTVVEALEPGYKKELIQAASNDTITVVERLLVTHSFSNLAIYESLLQSNSSRIRDILEEKLDFKTAIFEASRASSSLLEALLNEDELLGGSRNSGLNEESILQLLALSIQFGDKDAPGYVTRFARDFFRSREYRNEAPQGMLKDLFHEFFRSVPKFDFMKVVEEMNMPLFTKYAIELAIARDDPWIMKKLVESNLIVKSRFDDPFANMVKLAAGEGQLSVLAIMVTSYRIGMLNRGDAIVEGSKNGRIEVVKVLFEEAGMDVGKIILGYNAAVLNAFHGISALLETKVLEFFFRGTKAIGSQKDLNHLSIIAKIVRLEYLREALVRFPHASELDGFRVRFKQIIINEPAARAERRRKNGSQF